MAFLSLLSSYSDWGLLALRLAVGAIFIVHGKRKMGMWKMQPSEQMPSGTISLMKFLSIVEPLGGIALIIGFLTPVAASGLGLIMLGALWMKLLVWKAPFVSDSKTGWEFDLLILASTIVLITLGAGLFSVDYFMGW